MFPKTTKVHQRLMIVYKMFKSQTVTTCIIRAQCYPSNCITVFISFLFFHSLLQYKKVLSGNPSYSVLLSFSRKKFERTRTKSQKDEIAVQIGEKKVNNWIWWAATLWFQSQGKRLSKPPAFLPSLNRSLSFVGCCWCFTVERLWATEKTR